MNRLNIISRVVVAVAVVLTSMSCHTNDGCDTGLTATRTIEVYSAATRTTIGYEGSDVSHLEWRAGDEVAYVTDAVGDVFKVAEMTEGAAGWKFDAEVPASAQSILVVYPVADNAGKSLAEVNISLEADVVLIAGQDFDGELLPMVAYEALPSGNSIDVVYNCLASVIRFDVEGGEGHETESLRALTLTADQPLTGSYSLDMATGGVVFEGDGNSVSLAYNSATETGEDVLLATSHELYVVVPSAVFDGVDVVVETDADSYMWSDGAMDLSHPERRLYRVALDLGTAEGAPAPETQSFRPVTKLSDVTDDGVYLIAVELDGKYYVTNNVPTDTSNYYYLTGVEVASDDNGVIYSEKVMNYTWSITLKEGGYEIYSANMEKKGDRGLLLITQGGTGMFSGEDGYEGKAWYVTPATADGYSSAQQPRRYWDIELDGEGYAVLRNKYDRGVDMFPCYKYCMAHGYFTLCFEGGSDKVDIQLLKLM